MDKNLSSVKTINGNEAKERSPETARLLSVLKYLCLAAIIIVAAMLMFVFLSSPVDGAIENALEKAGIEPLTEAPVAYAWTSPGSSGNTTTPNWVSRLDDDTAVQGMQAISFSPQMGTGDFTKGNLSYASAGTFTVTNSSDLSQDMRKGQTSEILFFWEITLDDNAKAAIANGQITSIVAKLKSYCGTGNITYSMTFSGHFFICYGTSSDDTLDGFTTLGSDTYRLYKSGVTTVGDTNTDELTIDFSRSTKIDKIRLGVYCYIHGDSNGIWNIPTANFKRPEVTSFVVNSCYNSAKYPQIRFAYGGAGTAGGTVNGIGVNTTYKANYSTATSYSGTINLSNVSVTVKDGYFFGGWAMSDERRQYQQYNELPFQDARAFLRSVP